MYPEYKKRWNEDIEKAKKQPRNCTNQIDLVGKHVKFLGFNNIKTMHKGNMYKVTAEGTKDLTVINVLGKLKSYRKYNFEVVEKVGKMKLLKSNKNVEYANGTQVFMKDIECYAVVISNDGDKPISARTYEVMYEDGSKEGMVFPSEFSIVEPPKGGTNNGEVWKVKIVNPSGGSFMAHTQYKNKETQIVGQRSCGHWALLINENLHFTADEFVILEVVEPFKPLYTDTVVSIVINDKTIVGKRKFDKQIVRVEKLTTNPAGDKVYKVKSITGLKYKTSGTSITSWYWYPHELVPVEGIDQDPYYVRPEPKFKVGDAVATLEAETVLPMHRKYIGRVTLIKKVIWHGELKKWTYETELSWDCEFFGNELVLIA